MYQLFDVLPDNFFRLLTGSNKKLYAEAVLLLYEHAQKERFGIRYDIMRDLMQELIETRQEEGLVFLPEDDGEAEADDQTEAQLTLEELARKQANALLRRLEKLGWIQVEVRDQFETYIVLPHYASRLLHLFRDLCEDRAVEYQRFAFVTYQLLTGDEARLRPAFAVREAYDYTLRFQQELITLYQNMKHHMDQIIEKVSVEEVLQHHFDVYKSQIVDKSYHRLKTSDHVSRYRVHILETVQKWLLDKDLLEKTIQDGVNSDFYEDRQSAEKDIRQALYAIERIYDELDDMFYRIDRRHNQYLRSSYDRARYLSQQHQGLDQLLADVLTFIAETSEKTESEDFPWENYFQLQEIAQTNEEALLPPRKKRPEHRPPDHETIPVPEEWKEEIRQESLQRMQKAVTRSKIERFVLERLGQREEMELRELAPQNVQELLYLGYVYLYGQDGGSSFYLERNEKRLILHIGPYRFNNHRLKRKV